MVNSKSAISLVNDTEEYWEWMLDKPPYRVNTLEGPWIRGALDLNREVGSRPCALPDSFGESAVEVNPAVLVVRDWHDGAE
jgi:hypothetical protein